MLPPFSDANLSCKICGRLIDREAYLRLIAIAHDAVRYGYQYRKKYEEDEARQTSRKRTRTAYYLVQLGPHFDWIGLAIISGVLGNAAWDVVKLVIKKAIDYAKEDYENLIEYEKRLVDNSQRLDELVEYVKQYDCNKAPGIALTEKELEEIWNHIDLSG